MPTDPHPVPPEAPAAASGDQALALLDPELAEALPSFELFFKTFGFKRIHGRVWGLLVLCGQSLSSKQISHELGISMGATSTTLNELSEWGAITTEFDSARRCHLHAPVGNALSIVATVFRRREQVVFQHFQQTAKRTQEYIARRHGERDPRVLTLRSIIATCELAEAMMQLIFSAVANALGDPQSLLARAVQAAFRTGISGPARLLFGGTGARARAELDAAAQPTSEADSSPAAAETRGAPPTGTRGARRARRTEVRRG